VSELPFTLRSSPSYPPIVSTYTNKFKQDSARTQQIYLNTATGALSYLTSHTTFPASAIATCFLHLGEGTSVSAPDGSPGPSAFDCGVGSNPSWFFCPRDGKGYQVMRGVGGKEDWGSCLSGMSVAALDYTGKSPVVGEY
jgi:hypothetical protein